MLPLRITLLGGFGVTDSAGAPVPVETRKARALLAILAMAEGGPMPRERLAGMLWSRGETRQALASLSQALYSLRKSLGESAAEVLVADAETVALDPAHVEVDALSLERTEAAGATLALYRGPFLDDLAIDAEEGFAEWRAGHAARLEEVAVRSGLALMATWEAEPDAVDLSQVDRLLEIDPYAEAAMRVRVRHQAKEGRQSAALEAADRFTARLREDLGIAPSMEFATLLDAVRRGDVAAPSAAGRPGPVPEPVPVPARRRRGGILVAAVIFLALGIGGVFLMWPSPMPEASAMRLLVRPFEAGDGVEPGLAEGFGDDLATELVRRAALDVLSRESGRLIPEGAARDSGASHVLRGRLRQEGGDLVLNLWIIDLAEGREVWAGRFSDDGRDPRAFRDSVVARVASQVDLALVPGPPPKTVALPRGAVPDYLRALSLLNAGTAEANARAIDLLQDLAERTPGAVEPLAALAVAYDRVAFEADDYARAAGLFWLEGYLRLKVLLAQTEADDPDLLAVRARLALRRRDYAQAEALSRRAISLDAAHAAAHALLAETLARTGRTGEARPLAERAIALSPAAPEDGYRALALAYFADGDLAAAREALRAALDVVRDPSLGVRVLAAAVAGAAGDRAAAVSAHDDLIAAVESRPYGAGRLGNLSFDNPRAATWRRPQGGEAAALIHFADTETQARLRAGLAQADPAGADHLGPDGPSLSAAAIDDLLFGHEIAGPRSWLVLEPWEQVRTGDGTLLQTGAFGPLPAAREGRSRIFEDRLCDSWVWQGTRLESCQLVVPSAQSDHALIGETGRFGFEVVR